MKISNILRIISTMSSLTLNKKSNIYSPLVIPSGSPSHLPTPGSNRVLKRKKILNVNIKRQQKRKAKKIAKRSRNKTK